MNVWLLVFTNVNTERVLGPFTNISIDSDEIRDLLTGRQIAALTDVGWRLNISDVAVIAGSSSSRAALSHRGGFESPWGDRAR